MSQASNNCRKINMASEVTLRRVPWIALALSFLAAGVGHVYCGKIVKGLPLYFAWLLVPLGGIVAAMGRPSALSLGLLLLPAVLVLVVYLYAAMDAWRLARQAGSDYVLRDYNRAGVYWLLIVGQLVFSIGLIFGVRNFVYEAFVIPTKSMSPTILAGDRILARKLLPIHHFPQRGDLIVYRNPMPTGGSRFLGRVVAVAGDKVEIGGERLSINGKELERDRVTQGSLKLLGKQVSGRVAYEENSGHRYLVAYGDTAGGAQGQTYFETTVPQRQVFVLGDNRDRSNDSRNFGSIHIGDVIGYVDYVFWPSETWSRFGVVDAEFP
ncbi:MAG: signal peptidase I [Pirellulaceae bacterium]|nr:signal peptidase I [Pirellulaceae bacterium]